MNTLSKLIYNLKNMQNFGRSTDDLKIGNRQIEFILDHFRAELISQRINQGKSADGLYHTLEVELTTAVDVDPIDPNVEPLKSKHRLPSMVTSHSGDIVDFVGPFDAMVPFQSTGISEYNIDMAHEYIKTLYMIHDDHLYLFTRDVSLGKSVKLKAAFSSSRDAMDFGKSIKTSGYDWEYPIPGNLINQLNNLAIRNEFSWRNILPPDLINDGQDAKQ